MKRYFSLVAGMIMLAVMAITAQAATEQITEGKQYSKLKKTVENQDGVVEFFSFYCPHCYDFEMTFHIIDEIKKNLPEGVKFTKYHAGFMGPLGDELTKTWAIAISIGAENKVLVPLFEGVQKTGSIKTPEDIRKVFVNAVNKNATKDEDKYTNEKYDAAYNSFMINALALKQKQAAVDFHLDGVPAFYVNGTYHVNNGGLGITDEKEYGKVFSKTINQLLKLK